MNEREYSQNPLILDRDQKMRSTLAINLNYLLIKSGESQTYVAEKTGISSSALHNYVKGIRYPRPGQLDALAKHFHVSVGELTDDPAEKIPEISVSEEAKRVAYNFDELDPHGRELVRIIIQSELNRLKGEKKE